MIEGVSDTPPETAPTRGLLGRLRRPTGEDPAAPATPPDPVHDPTGDDVAGDDLPVGPPPVVPEGVAPSAPLPGADALDDLGLATAGDDGSDGDGGDGQDGVDDETAGERQDARTVPQEGSGGRFARPLPRVMAVANQKGGVGKTTTTVNLSAALADLGFRVLIVDLDPQGNASTGVGINIRDLSTSVYDVLLHDAPMEDCIEATSVRNLYVAPANLDLAGAEIELVPAFSRELRLRTAIDSVRDDYDYILIDCPPSLGLLTVNSLAAASEVLVPIQCEYYALEGLGQLLRNVGLVQKNLNPTLEVSAILCVMYDARTKLADQVVAEVRSHFGDKVCRTVVPRTVRLSEAPSYGQPITAFDPSSRGSIAYKEVAKEVSGGTP